MQENNTTPKTPNEISESQAVSLDNIYCSLIAILSLELKNSGIPSQNKDYIWDAHKMVMDIKRKIHEVPKRDEKYY